ASDHRNFFEGGYPLAPLEEVHGVDGNPWREMAEFRHDFMNHEQAAFITVAEWAQQNSVHHAEDRGVGADAERKRGNRDRAESRVAPHGAEGTTEITAKGHNKLSGKVHSMVRPDGRGCSQKVTEHCSGGILT